MEYPTLTEPEKAIVENVRAELSQLLFCERVPHERWSQVTLACVIDLSGQVLRLLGADTERPPPPDASTAGELER